MPKVKVEKIIKAERGKVFSTITDFENLPGKLKLVGFLAKNKIEKSIGEVMDALAKIVEN